MKTRLLIITGIIALGVFAPDGFSDAVFGQSTTEQQEKLIYILQGAQKEECQYHDACFSPSTLVVAPNTKVTWIAQEAGHVISSGIRTQTDVGTSTDFDGEFQSSYLNANDAFSHVFTESGKYDFHSLVFGHASGQVIVTKSGDFPVYHSEERCDLLSDLEIYDKLLQNDIVVRTFLSKYPDAVSDIKEIDESSPLKVLIAYEYGKNNKKTSLAVYIRAEGTMPTDCFSPVTYTYKYYKDNEPASLQYYHGEKQMMADFLNDAIIFSPLKQLRLGTPIEEIQCRDSLVPVAKNDGSPACVKERSIPKLIERGWMTESSNSDTQTLKYSPVLFKGTGTITHDDNLSFEELQKLEQRRLELEKLLENKSLDEKTHNELSDERFMIQLHAKHAFDEGISWEFVKILWEKYKQVEENLDNFDRKMFPIVSLRGLSIGSNAYSVDEEYAGKPAAISVGILKNQFTEQTLEKTDQMLRKLVGDEIDIVYHKSGYAVLNHTEQLWKSTEDWNSVRLVRNSDDGLYCSPNVESSDHCYSLEEIVFGNGHKRSNQGWKVYSGAGIILPDNTTLTPVYKNSTLGLPQIDLNAMLDDKIFVDKCKSHGGTWNYERHDCEGLMEICNDIGGIYLNEDVTPPCTDTGIIDEDPLKVKVCRGAALIRISCVFEYEG